MLRLSFVLALALFIVAFSSSASAFSDVPARIPQFPHVSNTSDCQLCKDIVSVLIPLIRSNLSLDIIEPIAVGVCELIKPSCEGEAQCKELCIGVVHEYAKEVIYIATETLLAPNELCWIAQQCDKPIPPLPPTPYVPVPSNLSDYSGERQWPAWSLNGDGYFIHVTDFHLDPYYVPGTNTQCGLPLCCHAENGAGTSGYWGDYQCDTSPQLSESFVQFVSTLNPPPDFILYTGDDVPHNIWNQSESFNVASIHRLNALLVQYLPNIPIFSAVGNHEGFPVNQFAGPGSDGWLYDQMALDFAHYLPDDSIHTFRYGGYYQARIRPGLRAISVNGNLYQPGNFWLVANNTDVAMQLPWLVDVLQQVRALKEKAVIICHIWPSHWEQKFAVEFVNITRTFADVIIGQHYGHAHNAYGTGILSASSGLINPLLIAPLHHAYVGGSIVTFGEINPGYQIYHYSRDQVSNTSVLTTEAVHYFVDLDAANSAGKDKQPDWTNGAVDIRSTFQLKDLSAASWSDLANRILTDDQIYADYARLYYKGHAPADQSQWVSRTQFACDLLSGTPDDLSSCLTHIKPITDQISIE